MILFILQHTGAFDAIDFTELSHCGKLQRIKILAVGGSVFISHPVVFAQKPASIQNEIRHFPAGYPGTNIPGGSIQSAAGQQFRRCQWMPVGAASTVMHFDSRRQGCGIFLILKRPYGKNIVLRQTGNPGPARHLAISAGVNETPTADKAPPAFVFHNNTGQAVIFVLFHAANQRIQPDIDPGVLQYFIKSQHKGRRRKNATQALAIFLIHSVPPSVRDIPRPIFDAQPNEFLANPESHLTPVAVTQRQVYVNQAGSSQSAQQNRFFQQSRFFTGARRLKCRRHAGNAAANHHYVITDLEIHFTKSPCFHAHSHEPDLYRTDAVRCFCFAHGRPALSARWTACGNVPRRNL